MQEPLRNVAISSELLERKYAAQLDANGARLLTTNVESARRMHRMVKDLLDYTKATEAAEFIPDIVDATAALSKALENVNESVKATDAQIMHDPLPRIRIHEAHLIQLFQNLISNSLKYRKQNEIPRVHITARRNGCEWVFTVRDNGIGFDPAHSARIFGLFKRLHGQHNYPGTGIGLAICARIVEHYGGRIWADAVPDHGAAFHFSLPADGTHG